MLRSMHDYRRTIFYCLASFQINDLIRYPGADPQRGQPYSFSVLCTGIARKKLKGGIFMDLFYVYLNLYPGKADIILNAIKAGIAEADTTHLKGKDRTDTISSHIMDALD